MAEPFDPSSLIVEFRDEAHDQVDRLDARLLALEREGGLADEERRSLLRTLHTLKGNAGMLGLSAIRDFVHALENALKGGPAEWQEQQLEPLLDGAAALRRAIQAAGGEDQEEAFRQLGMARHAIEEFGGAGASAGSPAEPQAGSDAAEASSTDLLRVPFSKLDTLLNRVGELVGEADALVETLASAGAERGQRDQAASLRRRGGELRETVLSLRLVPIGRVLGRFRGLVRRLAREQGKEARLLLEGESTEVDKSTADALAEPLLHLVRNAIDHGIEPPEAREAAGKPREGTVVIRASQVGDRLRLEVQDDGAGLALDRIRERAVATGLIPPDGALSDRDTARLVFRPGFSTRTEVSTVSGQGVGLDVVRRSIRALRGELELNRPPEGGTRFVILLPLTVAIVPSLLFQSVGELMAVPVWAVGRTFRVERIERVGPAEVVRDGDDIVPLARPDRLFGWEPVATGRFAVVVRHADRAAAVTADGLIDQRDLVVKGLPSFGPRAPGLAGASVLPDGRVVLVLDPAELIELNRNSRERGTRGHTA